MTTLTASALDGLEVRTPGYDRSAVTAGIVHFGLGSFHRAHQAKVVDDLLERGLGDGWGICGVGVLPSDERMRQALAPQDFLYTLVEKHADGTLDARVIGSIVDYLFAPDDPAAVVERLADPATRIVSLTVTEGGYNIDQSTGQFDLEDERVAADVEALRGDGAPATVFGLVTAGLRLRRERGLEPFVVMSCDNLPGNGHVARHCFETFAGAVDAELGEWIAGAVRFPNSMVDRITPATTDGDRAEIAERFGIEDAWPVVCEPFFQWVLEETDPALRPPYEEAGVQLVDDVEPFELMKLRLLNASHQGIAYLGRLLGYSAVDAAASDDDLRRFLDRYMRGEAVHTLPPVPDMDLEAYMDELLERFQNPGVKDTVARLAAEASDRIPKWVLPVVRARLDAGEPADAAIAIVAAWARYASGVDEDGGEIEIVDQRRDAVVAAATASEADPVAFLADRRLFGDLAEREDFTAPFAETLGSLRERGARATLAGLLERLG